MKKNLSLILILFVCSFCFAQEADENVLNTNSKKTNEKTETLLQATKNNVRVTVEEIIPESENKVFSPNVNLIFYLPSLLGEVTGNSTYMGLRQDSSVVTSGTNFLLEGKVDIKTIWRIGFSWAFGLNPYFETAVSNGDNLYSGLGLTLGAGVHFHPFYKDAPCISGLSFYFYPMYKQYIVFSGSNFINWKLAWDLGYNFTLANTFTVYPYMRRTYGFTNDAVLKSLDFGIAIGIYFHRL